MQTLNYAIKRRHHEKKQLCVGRAATFPDDLQGELFSLFGLGVPLLGAEPEHRLQGLWPRPLALQRAALARRLVGGRVVRAVAPAVLLQVAQQQLPQRLHCAHAGPTQHVEFACTRKNTDKQTE